MARATKELWRYQAMSASGPLAPRGGKVGGFVCSTSDSGTLKITAGEATGGATILASTTVTAGQYLELGFWLPDGAYATLTDCTGTFMV
jgi:hypothetical protein